MKNVQYLYLMENTVRGRKEKQNLLFHTFQTEELVPKTHPIRAMKKMADEPYMAFKRKK
ncbi:MAG: hypothetical protein V3V10_07485 [Planctomycetota bacterium]